MSQSILFAEYHPWSAPIKVGGHHYAEKFLDDGWKVMWLANFLNVNRIIRENDYDRHYLSNWKSGVQQIKDELYTYTPFPLVPYLNLPVLSSLPVARNSLRYCLPHLSKLMAEYMFNPVDILWISQPRMYSITSAIQYKRLVYRMFDDVQHFEGEPHTIDKVEEWLCRKADCVFATSRSLVEKARKWQRNVFYLPNGADIESFQEPAPAPADLIGIPSPRLLYIGAIAEWFDFDLLLETARLQPDWSFVIVGPWKLELQDRLEQAKAITNIYYLGSKKPEDIPAYVQHVDLGIIPFIENDLTHAISPIKLFEYSAAGLPVVAPRLHEIVNYNIPILFYRGNRQFMNSLRKGLSEREELSTEFVQFGTANSWSNRYETIIDHLT